MPLSPEKQADILMKAYDTLRAEILDRMKTAFSHLGYVGALIAFVIPFAKPAEWYHWLAGAVGLLLLVWIAIINWLWLRNCASHLRRIEYQMHELFPGLLTWESRSEMLATRVLLLPEPYEKVFGPTPGVELKVPWGTCFYFVNEGNGEYSSYMSRMDVTTIEFIVKVEAKGCDAINRSLIDTTVILL